MKVCKCGMTMPDNKTECWLCENKCKLPLVNEKLEFIPRPKEEKKK